MDGNTNNLSRGGGLNQSWKPPVLMPANIRDCGSCGYKNSELDVPSSNRLEGQALRNGEMVSAVPRQSA